MNRKQLRQKRYQRAHNILKNSIKKSLRAFYNATREFGLRRKRYTKGGDTK